MPIDKSWTLAGKKRTSEEFCRGLDLFCEMAKHKVSSGGTIVCPCKQCRNIKRQIIPDLKRHIQRWGFLESYDVWTHHGEGSTTTEQIPTENVQTDELLYVLNDIQGGSHVHDVNEENVNVESSNNNQYYDDLFQQLETSLYPGCETYSSLNFLVKLMYLKVKNKWTNSSFTELLALLKNAFPDGNSLPESDYEAKKMLKKLGLGYESIHVCKYDCALYWKENENLQNCPVCGVSRWVDENTKGKKVPHKVLRYFPLKPRLQRLYASRHTSEDMRWHFTRRPKEDNILRHPADGLSWKNFNSTYPEFAAEPRNIRLGLATDGFNPFDMNNPYSMWPVIVTIYNLPPWKCMKDTSFMLTLLIPGPKSPGKDMDVFLRPLVDELNDLWSNGIETRDAFTNSIFLMRASLLWTMNDYRARSYTSGWSGQGYKACPTCNKDTPSIGVRGKVVYFGHRHFLPISHRFRKDKSFNGSIEDRPPPKKFTVDDVLRQLRFVQNPIPGKNPRFGGVKQKTNENKDFNWKKKSIFFELPYWSSVLLKHNLDVMHIEKNVCESLLGTIVGIDGKSKDTDNARRDLADMGIKRELHLYIDGNKLMKPAASFTLSPTNKKKFFSFLKNVKFPDGFASNLRNNVSENNDKIIGLKSHDCHVIIQLLLSASICGLLEEKSISNTIVELCNVFKHICARTLNMDDLVRAKEDVLILMCKLEKIFPPAFFDIMVHLVVHLHEEATLGGPVHMRWMYPFERYLKKLKDFIRNPARPEGSIAEAYVVGEALTFISMYLEGVETKFNKPERNVDATLPIRQLSVFQSQCRPLGKITSFQLAYNERKQLEWYILNNCHEIQSYLDEHKLEIQGRGGNSLEIQKNEFSRWFFIKIHRMCKEGPATPYTNELIALASRFDVRTSTYNGCVINGVKFLTLNVDNKRTTQNSGVSVLGENGQIYYGQLEEIIELSYIKNCSVVLFKCKWFDTNPANNRIISRNIIKSVLEQKKKNNITSVYIAKECHKDDKYILASQVKQVWYIDDLLHGPNWKIVWDINHRNIWDIPSGDEETDVVGSSTLDITDVIDDLELHRKNNASDMEITNDGTSETNINLTNDDYSDEDDTLDYYIDNANENQHELSDDHDDDIPENENNNNNGDFNFD